MKADILREKFLSFFKNKKHKIVESDSLVPKDDLTVLFTPAGMNQFKQQFLGHITDFTRAASSQRCLRTDDLDKVGKTTGHHTFFEMLGNFSFGDYFKEEAVYFAWEFLTKELRISENRLWVSVYKDDDEAYNAWKDKIKIPENRIVKLGDKENFWPSEAKEKGPNGPCGPCSEIFFDFGKDAGCGKDNCNPACGCGRFVEIWNLVFTQFNRKENGSLEPLPQKNIDTGMGIERLAAVLQNAPNNFETDLFIPVLKEIKKIIKTKSVNEKQLVYAIADHIKAVTFSIYDGILPSNEGRGYVTRKLIRISSLNLKKLGMEKAFLYKLVPVIVEIMKAPYPELVNRKKNISEIILAEENNFINTLNSSDSLLKENLKAERTPEDIGISAFRMYDTYGIPLELTLDWLNKHKIKFSQGAFNKCMEEQKTRSKITSSMKGDVFAVPELKLDLPNTKFTRNKPCLSSVKILKIIKGNNEEKKIIEGDEVKIILDKTIFYPESGGQVGDSGQIKKSKNIFQVLDTRKSGKIIIHFGKVTKGSFKKSDLVSLSIDIENRLSTARNHTATHLLQSALRKILGHHVQQQGSLAAQGRLRFDFTHFKNITKEELNRIEEVVNEYIIDNHRLNAKEMPLSEAKRSGALAFFAEKYESKVRIVSIGDFSKEFCGGTHLEATGQIGLFKILRESSIASGVRRIEAVTGKFAFKAVKEEENIVKEVSAILNTSKEKICQELEKKLAKIKEIEKQLNSQKTDSVKTSAQGLLENIQVINNIKFIEKVFDGLDMAALRNAVDILKQKTDNTIIALASKNSGKAMLVIGITPDLSEKGIDARAIIKNISGIFGGSGGGRKDFAQAGGNNPDNFPHMFEELKKIIANF